MDMSNILNGIKILENELANFMLKNFNYLFNVESVDIYVKKAS